MSLYAYLMRLEDTLRSRGDLTIERVRLMITTLGAVFEADVQFYDGSRLSIVEEVEQVTRHEVKRNAYKFHCQNSDDVLVFRYDNAPHYPDLATFPSHKHVGDSVVEAEPPDLSEVLREIGAMIYPQPEDD